jgi:hypothetical protein
LSAIPPRKFGLTVGPTFHVLGGILLWREHPVGAWVAGGLGTVLVLAALVAPRVLVPVERGWMRMAHAISLVTTPIVMGAAYFLALAPIGLIMRAAGRNPLRPAAPGESFWVSREHERGRRGGMSRQF